MRISSRGQKIKIPSKIRKGIRPTMASTDESDQEAYTIQVNEKEEDQVEEDIGSSSKPTTQEYRHLTRKEKNKLMDWNMRYQRCIFCMRRTIYSAELMCSCTDTKMIPRESELELPEFKCK